MEPAKGYSSPIIRNLHDRVNSISLRKTSINMQIAVKLSDWWQKGDKNSNWERVKEVELTNHYTEWTEILSGQRDLTTFQIAKIEAILDEKLISL